MTDEQKTAYIAAYRQQEALVEQQRRANLEEQKRIEAQQRANEDAAKRPAPPDPPPTPQELRLAELRAKRQAGLPLSDAELREVVDLLLGV